MKRKANLTSARAVRRRRMRDLWLLKGWTDADIGRKYGITKQRVGQILGAQHSR